MHDNGSYCLNQLQAHVPSSAAASTHKTARLATGLASAQGVEFEMLHALMSNEAICAGCLLPRWGSCSARQQAWTQLLAPRR